MNAPIYLAAGGMGTFSCADCGGYALSYQTAVGGTLRHWHQGNLGRWQFDEDSGARGPGTGGFSTWTTRARVA